MLNVGCSPSPWSFRFQHVSVSAFQLFQFLLLHSMNVPLQPSVAPVGSRPFRSLILPVVVAAVVAFLWAFPSFWYTNSATEKEFVWLGESTNVAGWKFNEVPVSKLAESLLVSDHTVNGDYKSSDESKIVRVFSAKRYQGNRDQESLLRHTPDGCWVGAGWKMLSLEPQFMDCLVHGLIIRFERRLFEAGGQRELVYFGALMGGKPLTFRLDHYQGAGAQTSRENPGWPD